MIHFPSINNKPSIISATIRSIYSIALLKTLYNLNRFLHLFKHDNRHSLVLERRGNLIGYLFFCGT